MCIVTSDVGENNDGFSLILAIKKMMVVESPAFGNGHSSSARRAQLLVMRLIRAPTV